VQFSNTLESKISPEDLDTKFFICPSLNKLKQNNEELKMGALQVFGLIQKGVLPNGASKVFHFEEIPDAILEIKNRKNTRPSVIKI
jgi:NADPH2:quinone reductase